jgi:alkylated DNA repair dioxygenase AlkB
MMHLANFRRHDLGDGLAFFDGRLPEDLLVDDARFGELWLLHPPEYHQIKIHGRLVATPRWQQAYGADYHYTGRVNEALSVPDNLRPFLTWAREHVHPRLNGILLNWYEGALGHYIGAHRDSTVNMIDGAPIVTISFGEERVFRLRPWKGRGHRDFRTFPGSVFVMPFETNLRWTHEVPKGAKYRNRRISITLRAFDLVDEAISEGG